MIKRLTLLLLTTMFGLMIVATPVLAVDSIQEVCAREPSAVICKDRLSANNAKNPFTGPDGVLTKVLSLFSLILGIISVVMIIISGIRFITAYGDAGSVKKARGTLLYAIVGLIVAGSAQAFVSLILRNLG